MLENVYVVMVKYRRDSELVGDGYVATVQGGHPKIKGLFAFGETRKQAGQALAQTVYDALVHSRYDESKINAVALTEMHVVKLDASDGHSQHQG